MSIRFQSDIIGGILSSAKLLEIAWLRIPQKHTVSKKIPGTIKLEFHEVTLSVTCTQEILTSAKTDQQIKKLLFLTFYLPMKFWQTQI